jgi:hypothetical protein
VGGDFPVNSDVLLVTDFINLKIKPTQSFGGAHTGRMCVYVYRGECQLSLSEVLIRVGCVCMFIGVSDRTCISIYIYTVFLKKQLKQHEPRKINHARLYLLISLFSFPWTWTLFLC